ncbi:TetR/AcrR family transcriptional regulator [Candidatus Bipolaricaulota bacterium]|nr:TetR/AcrR family transcriptional regulator [Candidatus Bipolaricaulota bacterium]
MPRPFTEEERELLRQRLIAAGRELFARFGLRKTTVDELAQKAGLAKGTFYLFFPSKEALYAEVLLCELPEMLKRLHERSFGAASDIREALIRFQEELVGLIEENELVRAIAADPQNLFSFLSARLDLGEYQRRAEAALAPILDALREAQRKGELVPGDPMEILSVLGMIKLLPFYKAQIDPELYPRLVKRLSHVIADGLTCPVKKR